MFIGVAWRASWLFCQLERSQCLLTSSNRHRLMFEKRSGCFL